MQKYAHLTLGFVLILVTILVVAYSIDNLIEVVDLSLNTVANTTTLVTSIGTMVIALILFRRFNGSQTIVDNQTKIAMQLVKFLNDLDFYTETTEKSKVTGMYFNVKIFNFRWRLNKDNALGKDSKQYVDPSVMEMFSELMNYSHELYLPKTLANKIKNEFSYGTWLHEEVSALPKNYVVLNIRGRVFKKEHKIIDTDRNSKYVNLVTKIDNNEVDFEKSLEILEDLYLDTVRWIRKNNPDVYRSLNISEVRVNDFT